MEFNTVSAGKWNFWNRLFVLHMYSQVPDSRVGLNSNFGKIYLPFLLITTPHLICDFQWKNHPQTLLLTVPFSRSNNMAWNTIFSNKVLVHKTILSQCSSLLLLKNCRKLTVCSCHVTYACKFGQMVECSFMNYVVVGSSPVVENCNGFFEFFWG